MSTPANATFNWFVFLVAAFSIVGLLIYLFVKYAPNNWKRRLKL